jgi:hypothetical protein
MDFADILYGLSKKASTRVTNIRTEEATKNALVMPFITTLGYNVFDPTEVVPEFTADIGERKGEKVDYAILKDEKPIMLFECKQYGSELAAKSAIQLQRYFHGVPEVKFGILTDGIRYLFFSDLDRTNVMDSKPFFVIDLIDLEDAAIEELKRFTKPTFDVKDILDTASELKYTREIQALLRSELASPTKDFVRLLVSRVYDRQFTKKAYERFTPIVKGAFLRFINERINETLETAKTLQGTAARKEESASDTEQGTAPERASDGIITTAEELQGYYIVKAALSGSMDLERVVMRDLRSYCSILLDNTNRKPICRLYFNNTERKYLGLFDKGRDEDRVRITKLDEIFNYADRLKATIERYESSKSPWRKATPKTGTQKP